MNRKHSGAPHPDTPTASPVRRFSTTALIGRLAVAIVLGLAFVGYLTPGMRIQWANLMTLCGF